MPDNNIFFDIKKMIYMTRTIWSNSQYIIQITSLEYYFLDNLYIYIYI